MARKQKILLVDDRAPDLHAMATLLAATGAEIITAHGGNEALKATLSHDFALAILDVNMPGMGGFELGRLLRGEPRTRDLAIIFLTASSGDEVGLFKGYEIGAVDYLVKPIPPAILRVKVGVFLDLARRSAELRAAEAHHRAILETVIDGIITIDARGVIQSFNPAATRIFGYSVDEVMGANVSMLMPEPDRSRHDGYIDNYLGTGTPKIIGIGRQVVGQRKDGTRFPMELGISEVLDEDQRLFVGIVRDVTYRVQDQDRIEQLNAEVLRHNQELERLVLERTMQLAASEAELRTLVETSPAVIARIRSDGTIEFINTPPEAFAGMWPVGSSLYDHLPAQRSVVQAAIEDALSSGESRHFEAVAQDNEGHQHRFSAYVAGLGSGDRAIIVAHDVTERRQAEAELRLITEGVPTCIAYLDRDQRYRFTNRRYQELVGVPAEGIVGQLLRDVVPEPVMAVAAEWVQRALSGEQVEYEDSLPRADGGARTTSVRLVPDLREGAIVGFYTLVTDITERQEAARALREEEQRYRTLVEGIPDMVFRIQADGTVVDFVPAAAASVQPYVGPSDFIGKNLEEVLPPDVAASMIEVVGRALASGRVRTHHYSLTYPTPASNGVPVKQEFEGRAMPTGAAEVIWCARDVTDQKKLEQQLRQAQKMEAVGRLAGGVAHDFNNLLTVIISFAAFVRDGLSPEDPRLEDIKEVLAAADKAAGLTRQLLLFSRQQPTELHAIALGPTLQSLERFLRTTLGKDIDLTVTVEDADAVVFADATQLDQIVLNLAVNARDAMPRGGALQIAAATVDVSPETPEGSPGPGRQVRIRFTDSGTGMDEATMAQIFEPFFTTKGPTEGTGLGLATCYGIVSQLGGTIGVESELGAGTTFTIHLPHHAGDIEDRSGEFTVGQRLHGSETILVVEDEPALRRIAERTLTSHGYQVLLAEDGIRGLELFETNADSIDLVFSDIVMPRGGGFDLVEEVRRLRPDARVLLTSGYTDRRAVKEGSAVPIFWKPYSSAELARRIREALDAPPTTEQPR